MRLDKINAVTGKASIYAKSTDTFPKKDDLPYTFDDGSVLKVLVEGTSIFCTDNFDLYMYQKNDTWSNGTNTR